MHNSTSMGAELVSALCRAAVGGPVHGAGLRHTLQTLVLGWVGLSKEAVKGLTGCLLGGKSEEGQGLMHTLQTMARSWVGLEGAKQGFHFASELPDATISSSAPVLRCDEHSFPALESFGLIQQSNHRGGSPLLRSLPFLKRLLRACLARGITDVDLSRNGLRTVDVVEMIQVCAWPYCILLYLSHFVALPLLPSFPSLHSAQFLNEDPAIAHYFRALPSDLKVRRTASFSDSVFSLMPSSLFGLLTDLFLISAARSLIYIHHRSFHPFFLSLSFTFPPTLVQRRPHTTPQESRIQLPGLGEKSKRSQEFCESRAMECACVCG